MARLIFDLDGTLIDSAPDIHVAANRLMATLDQPPFTLAEITSFIGNGVPVLVQRIMAARALPAASQEALVAQFMTFYNDDTASLTRPYPNVAPALAQLVAGGHVLGICTNKPEIPTRQILSALDLARYFSAIVSGDSLPVRKPSPEPLLRVVELLNAKDCLYIGDSEVDAETAERAHVPFLLFTEGYRKSSVQDLRHHAGFDDFAKLPGLIETVELQLSAARI